jgi:small subunit ribosomal protein S14
MAKKSMVLRDVRRAKLVQQYAKKRKALKTIIANPKARPDDKQAAMDKLQALPRDSSPSRMRSRCSITGRSRGYYQKFGLSRCKLRELTLAGHIPGLSKASW